MWNRLQFQIQFWYLQNGPAPGNLQVILSEGVGESLMLTIAGNQGTQWKKVVLDVGKRLQSFRVLVLCCILKHSNYKAIHQKNKRLYNWYCWRNVWCYHMWIHKCIKIFWKLVKIKINDVTDIIPKTRRRSLRRSNWVGWHWDDQLWNSRTFSVMLFHIRLPLLLHQCVPGSACWSMWWCGCLWWQLWWI